MAEIDDSELVNEDDLLLSDEETSPTNLSQQDEALLLDDDEMHAKTGAVVPDDEIQSSESIGGELVAHLIDKPAEINTEENICEADSMPPVSSSPTPPPPPPVKHNRVALKRHSIPDSPCSKVLPQQSSAVVNSELRADAAIFVPDTCSESVSSLVESTSEIESAAESDIQASQVSTISDSIDECISKETSSFGDVGSSSVTTDNDVKMSQEMASEAESDTVTSVSAANTTTELETEDSDDGNERLNPKTRVERDTEMAREGLKLIN